MKFIKRIFGLAVDLVVVCGILLALRKSFEGFRFLFAHPHELLFYVAIITIVGGFVVLDVYLLPRTKRQFIVFVWGAAASTWTAIIGYFAFSPAFLSSLVIESGGTGWVLLCWVLLSVGIASGFWFEFYRALKTGVPS